MRGRGVDVESIERATLAAVAPEHLEILDGWLVPLDSGTVGRARSAVPLTHRPPSLQVIGVIEHLYRERGHVPRFRLPEAADWAPVHGHLMALGYQRAQPTLTQTADLQALLALTPMPGAALEDRPDAAWMDMFLGEGLDPVDGASRSRALARAQGTMFASLRQNGRTVACGAAGMSHGWLGVHGMRTAADQRGRGLARAVLHAMAQEARRRGIDRVFLQVDAANAPALALYARIGFQTAWRYAYWLPPATSGAA